MQGKDDDVGGGGGGQGGEEVGSKVGGVERLTAAVEG